MGWDVFVEAGNSNRRWKSSLLVSFLVHCAILYVLVRPPRPIYVSPSSLAFGHGGTSTELVYFSQRGSPAGQSSPAPAEKREVSLKRPAPRQRPKPAPKSSALNNTVQSVTTEEAARAGSPFGSTAQGPTEGHDVRPALPVIFPDPAILPWQIPSGVEGNVIVEVTIDIQGNVVETKVLKGLGYGIEEKVIAALRGWRFRPAMMDGRPIASQQDVYFHFPS